MSSSHAIAATTATLRHLLETRIPQIDSDLPSGLKFSTLPLDLAAKDIADQDFGLNLFLYQTLLNPAWRNLDMPVAVRPGETATPPLAINLHYLITAYGKEESTKGNIGQRILGAAMNVLHDHPLLGRTEIAAALNDNNLDQQFERLRITPLPTSVEELSKLWMIFQTQYRISAAYEVTVVLIDSKLPVKASLPVLRRGPSDRGATAVARAAPILSGVRPPNSQLATRLGEDAVITGEQLDGAGNIMRFTHQRTGGIIEIVVGATNTNGELSMHLPSQAEDAAARENWSPGFYTLAIVQTRPNVPAIISNEISFALAPRITVTPIVVAAGTVNLSLTCEPRIKNDQRILLLFGSSQITADTVTTPADTTQPTTLTFVIDNTQVGNYVVRLRVDGVDSIPVAYSGTPPLPDFDLAQKVSVQ